MDHFHSVMAFKHYSLQNVYRGHQLFYPPLATLFYFLMYRLIPSAAVPETDFLARERPAAVFPFLLLTVLVSLGTVYILNALHKGTNLEKKLFCVAMLLSAPMLYQYDRGNIVFLALLFSLVFFYWKDSDSRVKRELALICLAISAGLKIYPALFGLVLVFEKRWREALRCLLYGLLSFFLPAIAFGGVSPLEILENLSRISKGSQGEGFGYKVNYSNTLLVLCRALRIPHVNAVLTALSYVLGALVLGAAAVYRRGWKFVCALKLIIVALPGFSYAYALIFMMIPAALFLNEHGTVPACAKSYVYAFLLACCFIPLPFTGIIYSQYYLGYPLTFTSFVQSIAILVLSILLVVDACLILRRRLRERRTTSKAPASV
jgi:hypothetical protein